MCTLVPMRSVPHRVVCLMGLDDGVFPRQTALDGDDRVLADPHVGDRDERCGGAPQLRKELEARGRDHAERALGPEEQAADVVAGIVLAQRAEARQYAAVVKQVRQSG